VTTVDVPKAVGGPEDLPEPATLVLLAMGVPFVGGMALARRRPHPIPG
jgi:PEP-CTERM motif